jgi:predicted transcriptional regulator
MRSTVLFLDTNILLDSPRLEEYRLPGRQLTLVVIPEVMQELRGLAQSRDRGQTGAAMQALAGLQSLARRGGGTTGIPVGRAGTSVRVLPGSPRAPLDTDRQLVLRARSEQNRRPDALVAVVTRDHGVAELARGERVKSIIIRDSVTAELDRRVADHDTVLDIDL